MDLYSKAEIEKIASKILKDAGLTSPPIRPKDLLQHLSLNIDFYSLEDPSFVQMLTHKFKVKVNHLKEAVKKSKLVAAWLPDTSLIVIDGTMPKKKQIWPQFHEISHSILPWHKEFFLGDTAQMLEPEYQELLEEEANYGASELMFGGQHFRVEVKDTPVDIKNIKRLSNKFDTTITTTLRKFVISQEEVCCFAAVSVPPWDLNLEIAGDLKHLVPSEKFGQQFSKVIRESLGNQINLHVKYKKGGPVGEFEITIEDMNGNSQLFECETFFNTFEILTLGIHKSTGTNSRDEQTDDFF